MVARPPCNLLLSLLVVVLLIGTLTEASSAAKSTAPSVQTTSTPQVAVPTESTSSSSSPSSSASTSSPSLLSKAWFHTRRILNLSNTFGSATLSDTPYDRIASHPVFSITTPWGSPYLNMEKRNDFSSEDNDPIASKKIASVYDEQSEVRSVVLYFLDPDDALAVHGEMKQMESMEKSDIRITATSLAKALRQAANLGHGAPTGLPVERLDGILAVEDGAALRYKLVPPKRQLYYAARCWGKERVGLFADSAAEDAQTCVIGNSAIEANNLMKRMEKRDRKFPKQPKNAIQAANLHMEGYTGIPVFYCPELHRQVPAVKRLLHLNASPKQQVPLFFNYEDLMDAWTTMRKSSSSSTASKSIPEKPTSVEVYNLWDVLTSMERDAWQKKHRLQAFWKRHPKETLKSIQSTIQSKTTTTTTKTSSQSEGPDLNAITFVPSSRSIQYKEAISARGNGKARLRPMR